ncbi:MAG: hypothetical protein U0232_30200 [Thermomicrobiales bacterium]
MAEWVEGDLPVQGINVHYYPDGGAGQAAGGVAAWVQRWGLAWTRLARSGGGL